MFNDCPLIAFTHTEDAIAYTEDEGEVKGSDGWVGLRYGTRLFDR